MKATDESTSPGSTSSPDDVISGATLGELLVRARQDAVGRELRGMASRAGLPE